MGGTHRCESMTSRENYERIREHYGHIGHIGNKTRLVAVLPGVSWWFLSCPTLIPLWMMKSLAD